MLIEVALVSEQTLANLIPALHERPDRVLLVASAEMALRGLHTRQQRLLRLHEVEAEIVRGAPDADLACIHEFALDLLTRIQAEQPSAEIVLNATGGNKLMMLAFVDVFRDYARIVYSNTQHRRIETLPPQRGAPVPARPMLDVLNVPAYLRAQGFIYAGARSDHAEELSGVSARKAAAKHLGGNAARLGDFFGALNSLYKSALDTTGEKLAAPRQEFKQRVRKEWRDALRVLNAKGVVKWFGAEDLEFPDADSAQFCGGGWLEEYVWHIVHDANPFDARWSVKGTWEGGRAAENEFDFLAVYRNQLLFIECKTLKHGAQEAKDADIICKLESLGSKARGLFGESWLVAAREPTPRMADRAREQRVRILGPAELPRLRDHVQAWMQGSVTT